MLGINVVINILDRTSIINLKNRSVNRKLSSHAAVSLQDSDRFTAFQLRCSHFPLQQARQSAATLAALARSRERLQGGASDRDVLMEAVFGEAVTPSLLQL